jgi:hypothetical protein
LVIDLLCGLPGSDELAEYFMIDDPKYNAGWKEIDLLGNLLVALNTKEDVAKISKAILNLEMRYAEDLR